MKLQSNKIVKCNLLPLLLKHKARGAKTSECTVSYWPIESVKGVIEYLDKNKIKHETANGKLIVHWKELLTTK